MDETDIRADARFDDNRSCILTQGANPEARIGNGKVDGPTRGEIASAGRTRPRVPEGL